MNSKIIVRTKIGKQKVKIIIIYDDIFDELHVVVKY